MKRTPLNRISKQGCRKANTECQGICSKCDTFHIVLLTKKKHKELSEPFLWKTRKPINPISKKKAIEIENEKPIRKALLERCKGLCEHCGQSPDWRGLSPHEKVFRSHGGCLTMENSEMRCGRCHSVDGHNLKEANQSK
jgi:hypothetical protein